MAELLPAEELVNIAIREELAGATYYRAIAERAESCDLKEFVAEKDRPALRATMDEERTYLLQFTRFKEQLTA